MKKIEKNTTIYLFDPHTGMFMGKGTTGDSENYEMPTNAVIVEPPQIPEGHYAEWENKKWAIKKSYAYQIDTNGFFQNVILMPLPYPDRKKITLVEDEEPPKKFIKPHWTGKKWEDLPLPKELYKPVFDKNKKKWVEGARQEDIEDMIDQETNQLIQSWCKNKKKNEAYYINKGIENKKDPEYIEYQKAKDEIIKVQRKKKVGTGVYED